MADVDCIRTFVRIHYPTGRRRLVRHQPSPPSCRRSRSRDRRSHPRSHPRRTLSPPAASLVVPTISSTFSSKSAIAKFRNARQTKMADIDLNLQHRHVTFYKSLHLTRTLAARFPNAKFVHKNSLCFMGKIIFQLLSYLYLYDSGIPVPVRIRKRKSVYRLLAPGVDILCRRYTDFWRQALTYRVTGIPTSDAIGKFAQSRYTGFRHPKG